MNPAEPKALTTRRSSAEHTPLRTVRLRGRGHRRCCLLSDGVEGKGSTEDRFDHECKCAEEGLSYGELRSSCIRPVVRSLTLEPT